MAKSFFSGKPFEKRPSFDDLAFKKADDYHGLSAIF